MANFYSSVPFFSLLKVSYDDVWIFFLFGSKDFFPQLVWVFCLFVFYRTMLQRFSAGGSDSNQIHTALRIGFGHYFAELYVVGMLSRADSIQMPMQLHRCEKYICGVEVTQTSRSLIRYLQILLLHLMLYSIIKEMQKVVACSYNGTNAFRTEVINVGLK